MSSKVERKKIIKELLYNCSGSLTAGEILDELGSRRIEISKRTVERDLQELSNDGFIRISEEIGSGNTWKWDPGALFIEQMSALEAIVFALVKEYFEPLLPQSSLARIEPIFKESQRILENNSFRKRVKYLPRELCRQRLSGSKKVIDTGYSNIQKSVYTAVETDALLKIEYRSAANGLNTKKIIDICNLVFRDSIIELLAAEIKSDKKIGQLRRYQLQRIQSACVIKREKGVPSAVDRYGEVNLYKEFAYPRSGDEIDFVARISKTSWHQVKEAPINESQKSIDLPGGGGELRIRVRDTLELVKWIKGLGPNIEVIEPPDLRKYVKEQLQKTLALYIKESAKEESHIEEYA